MEKLSPRKNEFMQHGLIRQKPRYRACFLIELAELRNQFFRRVKDSGPASGPDGGLRFDFTPEGRCLPSGIQYPTAFDNDNPTDSGTDMVQRNRFSVLDKKTLYSKYSR